MKLYSTPLASPMAHAMAERIINRALPPDTDIVSETYQILRGIIIELCDRPSNDEASARGMVWRGDTMPAATSISRREPIPGWLLGTLIHHLEHGAIISRTDPARPVLEILPDLTVWGNLTIDYNPATPCQTPTPSPT